VIVLISTLDRDHITACAPSIISTAKHLYEQHPLASSLSLTAPIFAVKAILDSAKAFGPPSFHNMSEEDKVTMFRNAAWQYNIMQPMGEYTIDMM
jgi:hypothetical protein